MKKREFLLIGNPRNSQKSEGALMTLIRISEIIHGWLGWCPDAAVLQTRQHRTARDIEVANIGPGQDTVIPARTGWLKRYRNRVLLWALFYTLVFIPFVASFDALGLMNDVYTGILAGLMVFALFARGLLRGFDTAIAGKNEQQAGLEGYAILFMVIGMILAAVALFALASLAIIPPGMAMEIPAFATGFALIPWYVLGMILIWERRTGYLLMFDKKILSYTAVRRS
jgi:hypothetical protein